MKLSLSLSLSTMGRQASTLAVPFLGWQAIRWEDMNAPNSATNRIYTTNTSVAGEPESFLIFTE